MLSAGVFCDQCKPSFGTAHRLRAEWAAPCRLLGDLQAPARPSPHHELQRSRRLTLPSRHTSPSVQMLSRIVATRSHLCRRACVHEDLAGLTSGMDRCCRDMWTCPFDRSLIIGCLRADHEPSSLRQRARRLDPPGKCRGLVPGSPMAHRSLDAETASRATGFLSSDAPKRIKGC